VTVITAGSPPKTGESRLDLVQRNAAIFQDIITMVVHYNPDGILLVATNPVDILTCITLHFSGFPPSRVIGSGTILDTARFRYLVSQEFGVDPRSVHAYIIGEHGDSEVPVWSLANVAGMRIPDFCAMNGYECNQDLLDSIFERTRDAAYQIIERKNATYYAIASELLRIVEAILRNQGSVLSVSSLIEDYYGIQDVCLSLPSVIDHTGVRRVIRLELDDAEIAGLRKSAEVLSGTMKQLNLDDHHVI
jgi:L-lactate dehydrogenase